MNYAYRPSIGSLTAEIRGARVQQAVITEDSLTVELADGRSVSVPWRGTRDCYMGVSRSAIPGG
jgi:hypothetical protein